MFPVDTLQAVYFEERQQEYDIKRKVALAEAARKQADAQKSQASSPKPTLQALQRPPMAPRAATSPASLFGFLKTYSRPSSPTNLPLSTQVPTQAQPQPKRAQYNQVPYKPATWAGPSEGEVVSRAVAYFLQVSRADLSQCVVPCWS